MHSDRLVGLDRGKMTGGESVHSSFIVVRISSEEKMIDNDVFLVVLVRYSWCS